MCAKLRAIIKAQNVFVLKENNFYELLNYMTLTMQYLNVIAAGDHASIRAQYYSLQNNVNINTELLYDLHLWCLEKPVMGTEMIMFRPSKQPHN